MQKRCVNDFTVFEEVWHAISHGFGLLLSTFGFGVLITLATMSGSVAKVLTSIVFGVGLLVMYGSSTLYHAIPQYKPKSFLQILDHAAIYFLIASTYTPITILGVQGTFGWILFGIVWGLAALGIFLKFFFPGRFEVFSLLLYAIMGWLIVVAIHPFVLHVGWLPMIFLFVGGVVYSVGIFFYSKSSITLNHALWHLFVLGGTIFHYFAVFLIVK